MRKSTNRMKGRFPYEKLLKYPHLSPQDKEIWEKFIKKYPDLFDSVDYDVKVGKPREYKTAPEDIYKKDLQILSKKRIDVVAYKNEQIFIIEIHPSASFETLGQIIGKISLYKKEFKPRGKIKGILVTDKEIPDIRELCEENNIDFFLA